MDEYKYIHDILYEWSKELKTPKKALERQRRTLLKIFSGKATTTTKTTSDSSSKPDDSHQSGFQDRHYEA